jgi:tRNA U54 and U55 pseudouridine synthase Pus10
MEEFKKQILDFLEEEFSMPKRLRVVFDKAKDNSELGMIMSNYTTEIADLIGHECEQEDCDWCEGECDDCKDKDSELEELLTELENQEVDSFKADTYIEQEKLNIFKTYHEDFTIEEINAFLSSRSKKIVI